MGVLNLVIAFNFPTDTWVNFKLFGGMGLMLVFVLGQGMLLSKYIEENDALRLYRRRPRGTLDQRLAARPAHLNACRPCRPKVGWSSPAPAWPSTRPIRARLVSGSLIIAEFARWKPAGLGDADPYVAAGVRKVTVKPFKKVPCRRERRNCQPVAASA